MELLTVILATVGYFYIAKNLKRKAKNHNSKLKTFSLNIKF